MSTMCSKAQEPTDVKLWLVIVSPGGTVSCPKSFEELPEIELAGDSSHT